MTIKPLTDWLARNQQWFLAAALVGVIAFVALGPAGCQLLDPPVNVPKRVQADLNSPETVPLSQAKTLLDEFRAKCEARIGEEAATLRILGESINAAETTAENWRAVLWQGIEAGQTAAGAVPGVGLVLPALTAALALFIPRPGTRREIQRAATQARAEVAEIIVKSDDPVNTARQIASVGKPPSNVA